METGNLEIKIESNNSNNDNGTGQMNNNVLETGKNQGTSQDNITTEHTTFQLVQTFPLSFNSKYKKPKPVLSDRTDDVRPNIISSTNVDKQSSLALPEVVNPIQNVSQSWSAIQAGTYQSHENTMRLLDNFVKTNIFHKIAFISHPSLVAFSKQPQSLCSIVCSYFNVPDKDQEKEKFWSVYYKHVEKKLNQKRSDVSNAMKKIFKGKFIFI